jgi:hypothetical protein
VAGTSTNIVPLGAAVMRLQGCLKKLDYFIDERDFELLRMERASVMSCVNDYIEAKNFASKDSLVDRYYIRVGDLFIKELQTKSEIAVSLLRSSFS